MAGGTEMLWLFELYGDGFGLIIIVDIGLT